MEPHLWQNAENVTQKSCVVFLRVRLGVRKHVIPTIEKHAGTQGINKTFDGMRTLYLAAAHKSLYTDYTVPQKTTSMEDFAMAGLNMALFQTNGTTALGPGSVTYTFLRNLPDTKKCCFLT